MAGGRARAGARAARLTTGAAGRRVIPRQAQWPFGAIPADDFQEEPMRSARVAVATALAASTLFVAAPAHARHVCNMPEQSLDEICESHPENDLRRLICLVLPTC